MKNTSSGAAKIAKGLYLLLIVFFLYLPIGTLMVLSFNSSKSMASWQGFSLKWYKEMFANEELMEALGNTLTIALWASIIATVIGVMACVAMNAMTDRKRSVFMGLNNIPLLNADIVTGISIMMSFLLFGISLNYGTVLFAHIKASCLSSGSWRTIRMKRLSTWERHRFTLSSRWCFRT